MKYKVGDKVKVRKDLVVDSWYGEDTFQADMKKYSGKTMTVDEITNTGKYRLKEDIDEWGWTDEMLEGVESVEGINIIVDGNKVIAKRGNNVGIAKCSPEDEFDIFVGAKLAIDRLEEKCKPYSWLKDGVRYFVPSLIDDEFYTPYTYRNDSVDIKIKERGIAFKTKEEAIAVAKKILTILKKG